MPIARAQVWQPKTSPDFAERPLGGNLALGCESLALPPTLLLLRIVILSDEPSSATSTSQAGTWSVGVIYILETCWMSSSVWCWFDKATGSEFSGADLFPASRIRYWKRGLLYWEVKLCCSGHLAKGSLPHIPEGSPRRRCATEWPFSFGSKDYIYIIWGTVWVMVEPFRLEWIMLFGGTVGRAWTGEQDHGYLDD